MVVVFCFCFGGLFVWGVWFFVCLFVGGFCLFVCLCFFVGCFWFCLGWGFFGFFVLEKFGLTWETSDGELKYMCLY